MCVVGRSGAAYLFHGHGEVFDGVLHVTSVSKADDHDSCQHVLAQANCMVIISTFKEGPGRRNNIQLLCKPEENVSRV